MKASFVPLIALFALAACAQAPSAPGHPLGADWALHPPLSAQPLSVVEPEGCPPAGWDRGRLEALKAAEFEIADTLSRESFAGALTACLASPDPWLRDGVAYEALSHMLRERQLSDAAMRGLLVNLSARLGQQAPDPMGFGKSFAALALSEVARADRIETYLTEDELRKLLVDAQHWFINISDYRGFSEEEGWRHAVAHGSDLLMQLALNPRVDAEGLRLIVSAVGAQAAPVNHAYVHGESERLARPILSAAQRGALSETDWTQWLAAIATPDEPDRVFTSQAGLIWRHNTMGLLLSLHANVALSQDQRLEVLRPALEAALKAMP
jgi:hypothetical protein